MIGDVKVFQSTPKSSAGPRPALIWAHGGGGVLFRAQTFQQIMEKWALDCDCVTFNVDYRLAPEHPSPAEQLDLVAVVKHVAEMPRVTDRGSAPDMYDLPFFSP